MTAVDKKQQKRHRLLDLIRRQAPVSRVELARQVPWSMGSVCTLVQELLDESLILEELEGDERRGRQPVPLRPNAAYGRYLGLDLEAMRMRLVCVDFAGHACWQEQIKLPAITGKQDLLQRVLAFLDAGLEKARAEETSGPVLGIGLAAPGVCDAQHGTILHYDLLPEVRNLPWRDLVAQHTGLPCIMDNNIRAFTLAEWMAGAGQHLHTFICLAVRSGIGAGIVINDQLLRGSHGFAGEAGFAPVATSAPMQHWSSLQQVVSEKALGIDMEATEASAISEAVAKRAGDLLGAHLAGMASLFDPQAIILTGALLRPDGPIWRHVEATFRRHVLPDLVDRVVLMPSRVGPYAAAIGITQSCFEDAFPWQGDH